MNYIEKMEASWMENNKEDYILKELGIKPSVPFDMAGVRNPITLNVIVPMAEILNICNKNDLILDFQRMSIHR